MKNLLIAAGLAVSILSGCAGLSTSSAYVSGDQLKSIKKGAEQSDVVAVLGRPMNVARDGGNNVLEYQISDAMDGVHPIYVYFDASGKFTRYEERAY
jgi:outer membrane protein assembly factor BamE (lipoprotein component of BamABCDE complex)